MANVKISQLTAAASVSGTQEFEVNESGTSKKVTGSQILSYVEGEISSSPVITGQASFDDGTVTAPSITNTGDTNTGIYFPGADEVAITTGGTQRVKVDASGNTSVSGNLELGHASDTTLSRSSAGQVTVEGNLLPSPSSQTHGDILYRGSSAWERLAAGTSGQYLKTLGSGAAPQWASVTSTGVAVVRTQVFTASDTYTPHASMLYCKVTATGGGGGGGGADANGNSPSSQAGAGGGAGGTAIKVFSAATIGASQTVTIGAAGTAGSGTGGTAGGNGGNTTFGALLTANGGTGGTGTGTGVTGSLDVNVGVAGGTASSGDINITGGNGSGGLGFNVTVGQSTTHTFAIGGTGGASFWGGGGHGAFITSGTLAGSNAAAYGSGGGGAADVGNTTGVAGGAGAAGVVYVEEYCSA